MAQAERRDADLKTLRARMAQINRDGKTARLEERLAELEMKTDSLDVRHDTFSRNTRNQLRQVFEALRELATPTEPPAPPKRPIGFVHPQDKPAPKASKAIKGKKAT